MPKATRTIHSTDFKAKVLAELSQMSTADAAAKHGVHPSLIHKWKQRAGMVAAPKKGTKAAKTSRKRRGAKRARYPLGETPTPEQAAALADVANPGKKTLAQLAKRHKISTPTLSRWRAHFGGNGAAPTSNGKAASSNGKAAARQLLHPVLAISEARAQLSGILGQLDAISAAFAAMQSVFGPKKEPRHASE